MFSVGLFLLVSSSYSLTLTPVSSITDLLEIVKVARYFCKELLVTIYSLNHLSIIKTEIYGALFNV